MDNLPLPECRSSSSFDWSEDLWKKIVKFCLNSILKFTSRAFEKSLNYSSLTEDMACATAPNWSKTCEGWGAIAIDNSNAWRGCRWCTGSKVSVKNSTHAHSSIFYKLTISTKVESHAHGVITIGDLIQKIILEIFNVF